MYAQRHFQQTLLFTKNAKTWHHFDIICGQPAKLVISLPDCDYRENAENLATIPL